MVAKHLAGRIASGFRGTMLAMLLGILLIGPLPGFNPIAHAIGAAAFNTLLTDLGNATFDTREKAEVTLTKLATSAMLTGAQIKSIQDEIGSADPEVRLRAGNIFSSFIQSLSTYQDLVKTAGVRNIQGVTVNLMTGKLIPGQIRFDEATGTFLPPPEGFTSLATANLLSADGMKVSQALQAGDVAAAMQALMALKADVQNLTGADISKLVLDPGPGQPRLGKMQMLQKINAAIAGLPAFGKQLKNGGANPQGALPPPVPVQNAGAVPAGQSLLLTLGQITNPGGVEIFDTNEAGAPARVPPGYKLFGLVYDIAAEGGLAVGGMVQIAIEFGNGSLFGILPDEVGRLEIFRYADGFDTFLPSSLSDPGFLTASYDVPSSGSGGDPFGEFAIVLAVPEPGWIGVPALCGLLCIAMAMRGTRTRYAASQG